MKKIARFIKFGLITSSPSSFSGWLSSYYLATLCKIANIPFHFPVHISNQLVWMIFSPNTYNLLTNYKIYILIIFITRLPPYQYIKNIFQELRNVYFVYTDWSMVDAK